MKSLHVTSDLFCVWNLLSFCGFLSFFFFCINNNQIKPEFLFFFSSPDPKAETRLYVTVNGFEFHVYNRTDLYAQLQETFGLEPTLMTPKKEEDRGREDTKKTLERSDKCSQGQLSLSASF